MSVLAVGVSHRSAQLSTLEQVTVGSEDLPKLLHELLESPHIGEVMLVSTCNRTEVYAAVETFHGALTSVCDVLARHAGLEPGSLYDSLYVHYSAAAVEHVFNVAAGLDSMVVGETQILGQVRAAYAAASAAGTVGSVLHELVQTTLRVGKRVHTETGLGQLGASVVSEALAVAGEIAGRHAVIVGAGSMGALAASRLQQAEIGSVRIVNRTLDNAERIAADLGANGVDAVASTMDDLADVVAAADVVVSCTGASSVVLDGTHVADRGDRPVVICDLSLPRDVDAAVGALDGVRLVDLETLRRSGATGGADRDVLRASGIVLDEVREYLAGQRSAQVTPTVTALRKRAAEVVDAELLRLDRRIGDLDDDVREEVGRTVRRVVDKLLHAPTVRVKQLAAAPSDTDYADALRELFGLDPAAPAAVSTAALASDEHSTDQRHEGGARS